MDQKILVFLKQKTLPDAQSSAPFRDDEHISKGMLAAHLNPDFEGPSGKLAFIKNLWIGFPA
jgi:hypothetical protein